MHTSDNQVPNENRREFWDRAYKKNTSGIDHSQIWLEAYGGMLTAPSRILDLGCGIGKITEYLISKGHTVTAADISDEALSLLSSRVPGVETMRLDITGGLPWGRDSFDHVVADLCLHYFDLETTMRITADIFRVLKPSGFLLARVNSVEDAAHGYGEGREVQRNFFVSDGHFKRFFDRESIDEVFELFELVSVVTGTTKTSRGVKHLYELAGKKPI